jgi:hypothetical protein
MLNNAITNFAVLGEKLNFSYVFFKEGNVEIA